MVFKCSKHWTLYDWKKKNTLTRHQLPVDLADVAYVYHSMRSDPALPQHDSGEHTCCCFHFQVDFQDLTLTTSACCSDAERLTCSPGATEPPPEMLLSVEPLILRKAPCEPSREEPQPSTSSSHFCIGEVPSAYAARAAAAGRFPSFQQVTCLSREMEWFTWTSAFNVKLLLLPRRRRTWSWESRRARREKLTVSFLFYFFFERLHLTSQMMQNILYNYSKSSQYPLESVFAFGRSQL